MGGVFSKPKIPDPPKQVETDISAREKAADKAEADKKQQLARRIRARRTGAMKRKIGKKKSKGY